MTTKAEFDSFIAGFKTGLGSLNMISLDQFNAILAMVPDAAPISPDKMTPPAPLPIAEEPAPEAALAQSEAPAPVAIEVPGVTEEVLEPAPLLPEEPVL